MVKVLIVSDNVGLTGFFQEILQKKGLCNLVDVDYTFSAKNKSPDGLIEMGAQSLDFGKIETIDFVIGEYDFIFSLHCKQIFPKRVVNEVICVNLHPGLNPYNRGWYPQVFSIINKKPIGATLHFMDDQIDHGSIIAQEEVQINSWDTSLDVYNRVVEAEKRILQDNLESILSGSARAQNVQYEGNYNSISDFKKLCQLDLDSNATLREHIDLLRALTHGDFLNAYYVDDKGTKIFIKLELVTNEPLNCHS